MSLCIHSSFMFLPDIIREWYYFGVLKMYVNLIKLSVSFIFTCYIYVDLYTFTYNHCILLNKYDTLCLFSY